MSDCVIVADNTDVELGTRFVASLLLGATSEVLGLDLPTNREQMVSWLAKCKSDDGADDDLREVATRVRTVLDTRDGWDMWMDLCKRAPEMFRMEYR